MKRLLVLRSVCQEKYETTFFLTLWFSYVDAQGSSVVIRLSGDSVEHRLVCSMSIRAPRSKAIRLCFSMLNKYHIENMIAFSDDSRVSCYTAHLLRIYELRRKADVQYVFIKTTVKVKRSLFLLVPITLNYEI